MKSFLPIVVIGLFVWIGGAMTAPRFIQAADEIPKIWTLEEAVNFAVAGNPDSTIAKKRIEKAQAAAVIAKATDYPLINVSAEYGQTNTPMYSFGNILNQGAFDNSINFNDPGVTDNLQLKAMVQYRIYNGGRDLAEHAASAARIDISQTELIAVHEQLGFEVVKAFQNIILAEKMVAVRLEELSAITTAVHVGRARHEAGNLLRQDILNLELQQARASENLIQSRHALEIGKRNFLNLLGLQQGEVEIDPISGRKQKLPGNTDYRNRHELRKIEAMYQAAEAELRKAEGSRQPTLDGFAGYQVDSGFIEDETGDSWMAGVKVNYALFDGHKAAAEISLARVKLEEIQGLKLKTELTLNLEVQQALLNYKQAEERLNVTDKMVDVAEEVGRISRARFKEGVILASELIDLETRLTDARARQLNARAGYQVAIANLRRATGAPQFSDN
ncbi:MAG: TolC family protein [Proteobacteria bacterium]|nr:TolC family protein [Pseudomonadota bacterium]